MSRLLFTSVALFSFNEVRNRENSRLADTAKEVTEGLSSVLESLDTPILKIVVSRQTTQSCPRLTSCTNRQRFSKPDLNVRAARTTKTRRKCDLQRTPYFCIISFLPLDKSLLSIQSINTSRYAGYSKRSYSFIVVSSTSPNLTFPETSFINTATRLKPSNGRVKI